MKSRVFFPLLIIFSAFVFWGCQSMGDAFREPAVSLNSVSIAGISFNGVDLIVTVDVENPNRFSIPMPGIAWELSVNGASFLQGSLPGDQSIARRQSATVALPVSFTFEGLFSSFASLVDLKEAAYNIALEVSFPLPVMADRVFDLEYAGTLPLPQLPALSLGQMDVSRIDFSGIEMTWGINVENPNSFPIPFPSLDWDYSVNGVPVVRSSFAGAGQIAAGAAGVALITVSVAYADVLGAVGAALTGDADSAFSLGLNPEAIGFPLPALPNPGSAQSLLSIPGSIPILRMPVLSFQGITRRSLGLNRFEFDIIWEVENRNSFGFAIDEFNYQFVVNNSEWAQGRMTDPPRIAANGRTVIPLNVVITTPALVQGLLPILSGGANVSYSAAGNMSFLPDLPGMGLLELPLDFSGSTRIR